MKSFINFLINEINATNTLKKAVSSVRSTLGNPIQKHLSKIRKSINIGNNLSKYKKREARLKMMKTNASRIKKIQNTITNNRVKI